MLPFAPILDDQIRPLRRVEYDRLVEIGAFEGEKVELLYGRLVEMVPQGDDHAGSIDALTQPGHPDEAFLIIEVAATSQAKDRGPKGALYAAAGVPEHWLVDVSRRRVERYRAPLEGRYAESSLHGPDESLALVAFPDIEVPLAKILPR